MAEVFISYSRKDTELVKKIHTELKRIGRDIWVDWEGIALTADWLQEIYSAIEASDSFLFIISPDSIESEICSLEIAHAIKHNKRMIPVMFRETGTRDVHKVIATHNWVMMRSIDHFESSFSALIKALDTDLQHCKIHTRILIKALEWEKSDKNSSYLLRGIDLKEAEVWKDRSKGKDPAITEVQEDYLRESDRIEQLRKKIGIGIAGIVFFTLSFLSILFYNERNEAKAQARLAISNQAVSHSIDTFKKKKPILSLLLAIESFKNIWLEDKYRYNLAEEVLRNLMGKVSGKSLLESPWAEHLSFVYLMQDGQIIFGGSSIYITDYKNVNKSDPIRFSAQDGAASLTSSSVHEASGLLAGGGVDGSIRIWNLKNPSALPKNLNAHEGRITGLSFSPDGNYLVSASIHPEELRVWHFNHNNDSSILLNHGNETIRSIVFSKDGQFFYTGSGESNIQKWSTIDFKKMPFHQFSKKTAISKNVDSEGQISLTLPWELNLIKEPYTSITSAGWGISKLTISQDGNFLLACGYEDNNIRLWNLKTNYGNPKNIEGHNEEVTDCKITADNQFIISTSKDQTIRIYKLQNLKEPPTIFFGHEDNITSLALSPLDRNKFVTVSDDRTIREWKINVSDRISFFLSKSGKAKINTLAFSRNNDRLFSGSDDGVIRIHDLKMPELEPIELSGHENSILDLAISDSLLFSSSSDNSIIVWDLMKGYEKKYKLKDHANKVRKLLISPNYEYLISASDDGTIKVRSIQNFQEQPQEIKTNLGIITDLVMVSSYEFATRSLNSGDLYIYDIRNLQSIPKKIENAKFFGNGMSFVYLPDENLFYGFGENEIKFLNQNILKEVTKSIQVHSHLRPFFKDKFHLSNDSRFLITGNLIWDHGDMGRKPLIIDFSDVLNENNEISNIRSLSLNDISISSDSQFIAHAYGDKIIVSLFSPETLLKRACQIAGRNLSISEWVDYISPLLKYQKTCPSINGSESNKIL